MLYIPANKICLLINVITIQPKKIKAKLSRYKLGHALRAPRV
jgi:hypothetical protein